MPETEFGRTAAAINDAVKGTAIDRNGIYRGAQFSLRQTPAESAGSIPKMEGFAPEQSMAIEEDKSRNVRQEQLKPKLDITPLLGGERVQ